MIEGDLLFEEALRRAYSSDASVRSIEPLGVVIPRSREDVATTVRYAAEQGISVRARGAGTGHDGGCLGTGLVVDLSRYMRRVLAVERESVIVEAGAILDHVNTRLSPSGRRLAPDPPESSTCTIGGMIATDAMGPRSVAMGSTSGSVEWIDLMMADGRERRMGREPWPVGERRDAGEGDDATARIVQRVAELMRRHADQIARLQRFGPNRRVGYALDLAASPKGVDLSRLVCGSSGTLGLITAVRLRTEAVPAGQSAVVLGFARLSDALRAIKPVIEFGPTACELLDWRRAALAREVDPSIRGALAEGVEAALVVLFEGDEPSELLRRAQHLADRIDSARVLAGSPLVSGRKVDCDRWLALRSLVHPRMLRAAGSSPPAVIWDEIQVLPGALGDLLSAVQRIGREQDVAWTWHAHAGRGVVHLRPYLDLDAESDRAKVEPLTRAVVEAVHEVGGTISGTLGPTALPPSIEELGEVFLEVRRAFDPLGLFSPATETAVVGTDDRGQAVDPERVRPAMPTEGPQPASPGEGLAVLNHPLRWPEIGRERQIASCNDCGDCRTEDPALRMCPSFRGTRFEPASPRSQVKLLRQIATGEMDPRTWGSDELKARADLCVHCRLCRTECPARIDVSALMLEAKAAYVENHGLSAGDWTLSRLDVWARWASRLPILSRFVLENRRARWWLERLTGLSRHRIMPRPRRWSFLRRAAQLGLTTPRTAEPGPRVAYFVDVFADTFDQEVAESVVAVLKHAGVNVYVPAGQRGSGMPSVVVGDLDRARELLTANLRVLSSAVRDGYTVVCSEPTATLMFQQLALTLTDDLDAPLVAANTMDVGQYLAGLAARGGLPPLVDSMHVRVGYHQPCHLRALEVGTPGLDLIRTIPGVEAEFIDRGCSGMAGVFGMSRRNFRTSLRIGSGLRTRLRDSDLELGCTECGTCRMQMEQGSSKRTLHPMKLLAAAYGLRPELRRELKRPKPRHTIS
jgi:FAD/FMN-containing dehydrogenase/Fe-S oxidoreductase